MTGSEVPAWDELEPFSGVIDGADQVLVIAGTKGGKSTLAASLTLPVRSLVAIDDKERMALPRARVYELPRYDERMPERYFSALREALAWQQDGRNRVILRVHVLDLENFAAHDAIFRYLFLRGDALIWIDEITATGATPQRVHPWLRAITARGRTRGLGLWTMTQAPFGLIPSILRRNAEYVIVGPIEAEDAASMHRQWIEIATTLPTGSPEAIAAGTAGRFLVYKVGRREPYRLQVTIPPVLRRWEAP